MSPKLLRRLFLVSLLAVAMRAETLFHHHTFADFSKGAVSDSGANLYVSHQGKIQFVNLYDLNADGYPEVVVNNDHNHHDTPDVLIYHNRKPAGLRSLVHPVAADVPAFQNLQWTLESLRSITRLPAEGGGKAVLADLNGDGYKELLFTNFIHGSSVADLPTYLYWGGPEGFDPTRRSLLPGDRGTAVAVADLNGDGLPDIAVANAGREHVAIETPGFSHAQLASLAGPREKSSYVFYQTEAGFAPEAKEVIPTVFAVDVKVADLDRSGVPSLLFLEMGEPGALRIVRRRNDQWAEPEMLPVLASRSPSTGGKKVYRELLVKDLNGDGFPDIFAPSLGARSEIFWNDRGTFSVKNRTILETENACSADAADLNQDGYADLVIANFFATGPEGKPRFATDSYIWWGAKDGFGPERRTALPTLGATSVRLADVNRSGYLDVLFAQDRDGETFDVPSYIYFNSPNGFSLETRLELQGFGAMGILAEDLDGKGAQDVILVNSQSGQARASGSDDAPAGGADGVRMYIFRGNPQGKYGPANVVRVPASMPETGPAFADLEDKGKPALVHLRQGGRRLVIRYDINAYPHAREVSEIDLPFRASAVNVADYNRDGWLDVLLMPFDGPQAALIFGLGERKYRTEFFAFNHPAYVCATGDFDRDGTLDVVTSSHKQICLLRGNNKGGFHFEQPEVIPTNVYTARVSLADFNDDGWLDLLCQNLVDETAKSYDIESWVLVNDHGKFTLGNRRSFPTFGALGGSVAQLDRSGKLATVIANFHGDLSRRPATFVLRGDEEGFPSKKNKQRLPSFSTGGNLVLDFNGDGHQDILVFNHTGANVYSGGLPPTGGEHAVGAFLYWGAERGFRADNLTVVPSLGPQSRILADSGSVSRRDPFEVYTSDYIPHDSGDKHYILTVDGRFNAKQYVEPEILLGDKHSGDTATVVPALQERSATLARYQVTIPAGKTFRYRLKLHSSHSGAGPIVSSVRMDEQP